MTLDVLFCNAYVNNPDLPKLRRQLVATEAHVIALAEGQHVMALPGYVPIRPPYRVTAHAAETPVFLRVDVAHGLQGVRITKATDDTRTGYAHDRWIVEAQFRWERRDYSVINTHTNPSGFSVSNPSPGAEQNRRLLTAWRTHVREARLEGRRVITTGDWNAGPDFVTTEHRRVLLAYVVDDTPPPGRDLIDGIGYDPELLRLRRFTVAEGAGMDGTHKILTARLEAHHH